MEVEQFLAFIRTHEKRPARVGDLVLGTLQAWMDAMAAADLALSTIRVRQSTLSSLCAWLVKRGVLTANPVARLDRPPHRREAPRQVPGSGIMDALIDAAKQRHRVRDLFGKLHQRTGQREQAREHLTTATTMYREMGMTYWLEQAEAEMGASPRTAQVLRASRRRPLLDPLYHFGDA